MSNTVEDSYIAYIIPQKCRSYSVIATTSDDFYDLDASQHFLHVPVKISWGQAYVNKIKLEVKHIEENSEFQAIPFCIWKPVPSYRTKCVGIKAWTIKSVNEDVFTPNKINWRGSTSTEQFELPLASDDTGVKLPDTLQLMLQRPTWEYKANCWFIGLKSQLYMDSKAMSPQNVTYRIADNIEILHHGNQDKYNFIKADGRLYSYQKTLFYKRIHDVWDWLYCIKMLRHYQYAHYNGGTR